MISAKELFEVYRAKFCEKVGMEETWDGQYPIDDYERAAWEAVAEYVNGKMA